MTERTRIVDDGYLCTGSDVGGSCVAPVNPLFRGTQGQWDDWDGDWDGLAACQNPDHYAVAASRSMR
jgi:hypothetical protein